MEVHFMTFSNISIEGAAPAELARHMHTLWQQGATRSGVDLSGFNPDASLDQRVGWAKSAGLEIGCGYTRFSTKTQDSTEDQCRVLVGAQLPAASTCRRNSSA
jgi:hypothetical protein